jgi:hypothetical protein
MWRYPTWRLGASRYIPVGDRRVLSANIPPRSHPGQPHVDLVSGSFRVRFGAALYRGDHPATRRAATTCRCSSAVWPDHHLIERRIRARGQPAARHAGQAKRACAT